MKSRAWWLSQYYQCPEFDWPWPVCSAYGDTPCCAWHPMPESRLVPEGIWTLIRMTSSPQHIEASKLDPRVQYVGGDFDPVPAKVLEVFGPWLDPNVQYAFMGQVISRLAQIWPAFNHVDDNC